MTCPICDKASAKEFAPFCNARCQQVDLGKWLAGAYAVPVVDMDELPDEEPTEEPH